jgi:hypothetical protein
MPLDAPLTTAEQLHARAIHAIDKALREAEKPMTEERRDQITRLLSHAMCLVREVPI